MFAQDLKGILSISIKARHDSYTDQFTRIFMPKICIICSLVMGFEWFHDKVGCILPGDSKLEESFVHSACWIQGFYIYPELANRLIESNYYGIPINLAHDGMTSDGSLCSTVNRKYKIHEIDQGCRGMSRRYYLQYQYMPYYIASLAILYYLPYIFFRIVNTDMISLRKTVEKPKIEPYEIVENYFNYDVNSPFKMNIRVAMNTIVKLMYIAVNVGAFYLTNDLLYGEFKEYGIKWAKWARTNHISAFFFYEGSTPKPGNVLLPSFGFCDIQEAAKDIRTVLQNTNTIICEISPNILYQYTFIVLWICMVLSIVVSVLGLLLYLMGHVITMGCSLNDSSQAKYIYKMVTLRECEYLTFIRHRNIPLYGDILRHLKRSRSERASMINGMNNNGNGMNGHKGLWMNGGTNSLMRESAPPDEDTHWTKL